MAMVGDFISMMVVSEWTLLLTKADIMIHLGQDDWADDPSQPDGYL